MKRLLLACLALPLLGASPAPFTWGPWEGEQTQNPVEQQTEGGALQPDRSLWVVNNTVAPPGQGDYLGRCAWDADDSRSMGDTDGTIGPGVTTSGSKCFIADTSDKSMMIDLVSRSPDLVVTLSFEPQGWTVTAPPQPEGRDYRYELCAFRADYDETSPNLQPIPNSGTAPNILRPEYVGGIGVMTTVMASITNPTSRTVHDTHGVFRMRMSLSGTPDSPCNFGPDYPEVTPNHLGVYPGPFLDWWIP